MPIYTENEGAFSRLDCWQSEAPFPPSSTCGPFYNFETHYAERLGRDELMPSSTSAL